MLPAIKLGRLLCAHELAELIADSMNDEILVKIVAQRSRCESFVLTIFQLFFSHVGLLALQFWLDVQTLALSASVWSSDKAHHTCM